MLSENDYLEILEGICRDVIAPAAIEVDTTGVFPSASIAALGKAGLLGVLSAPEVGGSGLGPRAAAYIVERIGRECGSTAMITTMHLCGTAVLEAHADDATRRAAATGEHLSTLAFSEAGSRSHFWAPTSTATADGDQVVLNARKSWITSASHATAYVWSSKPVGDEGASTMWLVPADADGLTVKGPFKGLGLRGNDSSPVHAEGVRIPGSNRLGDDGGGFDIMMGTVLPIFQLLISSGVLGLMEGAVARSTTHVSGAKYEHLEGTALAELPTIRNYLARMKVTTDMVHALWKDTITAMETGRPDTMLRVLEVKAAAGERATEVLDTAMRICGGAAFRSDVGVERYFRDTRAAGVMAPTTDVLYDFIGKAVCGMELF